MIQRFGCALSYPREVKIQTEYVPRKWVGDMRRQIAIYKRLKVLTTQWIVLSIEQRWLKMKLLR